MKIFIVLLLFLCNACASNDKPKRFNLFEHDKKPYILLISIDGYRWDYTHKYKPKFLNQFRKNGTSLKSLIPAYPTKTFPNHLSIVTGLYPANHGIVANQFYAPDLQKSYSLRDRSAVTDARFYTGTPIWSLAEDQGMLTATYFYPGSEAPISGYFPTYYTKYNHNEEHEKRINQVIDWFKKPSKERPHFVATYFHDVDSAGHRYGPDSKEVEAAIQKVDQSIEKLVTKLNELELPLNILIVSDHGMTELDQTKFEALAKNQKQQDIIDKFNTVGNGPVVHLYTKEKKIINYAYKTLNNGAKNFKCYPHQYTPPSLKFRNNERIGDVVCLAKKGWSIAPKSMLIPPGGHGWSQFQGKDMHGIFYGQGPNLKKGTMKSQDNIHLFPLMVKILELKNPNKIDGDIKFLEPMYRNSANN